MPQNRYKVLCSALREWRKGDEITDEDLARHPELGGAERLRGMEAIEDIASTVPTVLESPVITETETPGPNARGQRRAGKSS